MWYIFYNVMLLSNKKEQKGVICSDVDAPICRVGIETHVENRGEHREEGRVGQIGRLGLTYIHYCM